MREDLIELAKQQAAEIARAGHNGWGNTMLALTATLEAAREDAVDAARWREAEKHFRVMGPDMGSNHSWTWTGQRYRGPSIAAAIDAARKEGGDD